MRKTPRRNPVAFPRLPARPPRSEAFKRWFGQSKVVDERGKPLIVFHGSNNPFYTFKYDFWGKTDPGFAGKGFYFTSDFPWAEFYAEDGSGPNDTPTVTAVYLRMENPLIVQHYNAIPDAPKRVPTKAEAERMQQSLISLGYDGIIIPGHPTEFVVFRPNQIKSVMNTGTWKDENQDIRYNPLNHY